MPILTPKGHYVIGTCEAAHENKGKKFQQNDGSGIWFKCGKPLGNGKFCDAPFTPVEGEPLCDRDGAPINGEGPAPDVGETEGGRPAADSSVQEASPASPSAPTTEAKPADKSRNEELAERFELVGAALETACNALYEIADRVREGSS